MANNRTSLINKIIAKGFNFTPLELIHMKYLSRKGVLNELIRAKSLGIAPENIRVFSPPAVTMFANMAFRADPEGYKAYNYAYQGVLDDDRHIGILGYRGLALLTQLISISHEFNLSLFAGKVISKSNVDRSSALENFSSYSFVHQAKRTYGEIVSLFAENFREFLKITTRILLFNYYIDKIIDLEDLDCLNFVRMWWGDESSQEYRDQQVSKTARLCFDDVLLSYVITESHHDFIENFGDRLNITQSFTENSLQYAKDTVTKTIAKI